MFLCILYVTKNQPIRDTTNKVVNNFKRAGFLGAKEHLSNITWENECANLDVNKSWDRLKHILKYIEDNYVQKRAVKRYRKPICSGVVGRERMGTAFPHKKLSGNGVPTREILRYVFLLAIFHYRHVMTFSAPETISKLDIRICKVLAH